MSFECKGLYIVTPDWDDTAALVKATDEALAGGASLVQYRHKTSSPELRREQATALLRVCRHYSVPLIINDHVSLCMDIDADGVHVGGTDISVAQAREMVGPDKIVGSSCYGTYERAETACREGASYIAFGGFYPSRVKKYDFKTAPEIVAQAKQNIPLPVVVIGGMTPENCVPLLEQGADMVAAVSSVYMTTSPQQGALDFLKVLASFDK